MEPPPRTSKITSAAPLRLKYRKRLDNLRCRSIALHPNGIERQVHIRKAPREDAHHVADSRARRRSNQPDSTWEQRQRLFSRTVEQPFFLQFLLQLFERQLQRAAAERLQRLHVNLILAARS